MKLLARALRAISAIVMGAGLVALVLTVCVAVIAGRMARGGLI